MSHPVPDATEQTHEALIELMKADAARQEPLVAVIGTMLEETINRNDLKQKQSSLPSFTGNRPPLSASAFVARIAKYSGASPCCYAIGLIYLERMKKRDTGLYLNSTNFQRLFLVATMTAAKFLDDFYYSNKHWAQIGGLTTQEINRLELEFLFRMGFTLHMQREEYDWYAEELLSRVDSATTPVAPIVCAPVEKKEVSADQSQPKCLQSPASSSSEDADSFLSTHSTPKSSMTQLPSTPHAQEQTSSAKPACLPVNIPLPQGVFELQRSAYEAHMCGATALHASLLQSVPQVLGTAVPVQLQAYHGGIPQQQWIYYQ